jgi:Fe2+ transport system protein FeoA
LQDYEFVWYTKHMNLSKSIKNKNYKIINIDAPDADLKGRFFQLGFNPGATIVLKRKAPFFSDPLLFEIGESQIALTKQEASYILVEEV